MEKEELTALIRRYNSGTATERERALLESWYVDLNKDQVMNVSSRERRSDRKMVKANLDKEYFTNQPSDYSIYKADNRRSGLKLWPAIAAVAATLLCILGLYLYYNRSLSVYQEKQYASGSTNEIRPGTDKATLILSNGTRVNLSALPSGKVAIQKGTRITEETKGELVYTATENHSSTYGYNTLETPKGGKYLVHLPDGTKVWLNAASTLKYPTSFTSLKERRVQLSGEAYFVVTHNKAMPFRVVTDNQVVEVLGTHFNIKSYPKETVKTTLLEGSVYINHQTILKPGQQAINTASGIQVHQVDTSAVVDWKNGYFNFTGEDNFQSAMHKVERWYDVQFVYDSLSVTDIDLGGRLSRINNLSTILKRIESTGKVQFQIKGRRILVRNK